MVRALSALVLVAFALPAGAASDLPRRIGMYPTQQPGAPLAMLDSDVTVRVRGPLVEATITQTFKNDTDNVTEATYIFPLPPDAAVSAMEITTGGKTIRAAIASRAKAVAQYEDAISRGASAGILEQERPDVFTQTVSAIPARGEVKVTLRFDTVAHFAHGTWAVALPLVVAPRYVPGSASGRPTTGSGRAPDTERAPDASRVTPGGAPGAGGRTDMRIEFADDVSDVASPTHELTGASGTYALVDPKTDHDAVIRWRTKSTQQAWAEPGASGGYAAVLVEAKPAPARKKDVEIKLVLDRAATTRGDAEAMQRAVVRALLKELSAKDRVAVAGSDTLAAAAPDAQLRALDEAWRLTAGAFDLTKVLTALRGSTGALVLVSDGLVADDKQALSAALKIGAPVHVIGVGPAPNRSLLTRIAQQTGGTIRFVIIGDDTTLLARDVIADAATPPETIAINWGTLGASDVVPAKLPRIGAGQALLVLAKTKKVEKANARVRGDVFGFTAITVPKPPAGSTSKDGALARRWAKQKLDDLVAANAANTAIEQHALAHGLVSPATAMIAVGEEIVVEGGVKHTAPVPVSVPEGMQWQQVKKQTTVKTDGKKLEEKVVATDKKTKGKDPAKKHGEGRRTDDVAATKKPIEPTTPSPDGGGAGQKARDFSDAEGEAPMDGPSVGAIDQAAPTSMGADYDDEEDSLRAESISAYSPRRAVRLALSLGAGVSFAGGESAPVGALGVRVDIGRGRTVAGLDASAWLVDGFHGQGGVFATVTRRGIARKLEVGAGLGVRFTGDALGPAINLALRVLLPSRGFAVYLRYDGALLRQDDVSTGQNAATFGVEARW